MGGMPDRSSIAKRPRHSSRLAKLTVDIATGEAKNAKFQDGKDPAAVALGRRGGLKGGKARAKKLPAKRRAEIARMAAQTRWGKS